MERIVQAALKRAEMVSTLPMPGRALAATDVFLTTRADGPSFGLDNCTAQSVYRICWR